MSRNVCEVCRGRQYIRLPLHKSVEVMSVSGDIPLQSPTITYKDYPCPECTKTVNVERLGIIENHVAVEIDRDLDIPDIIFKRDIAARMAYGLLDNGMILFEERTELRERRRVIIGTIGVVAPSTVGSIQKRISERAIDYVRQFSLRLAQDLMGWSSSYVTKSQIDQSLVDVTKAFIEEQTRKAMS